MKNSAMKWAEQFKDAEKDKTFFIIGFGDGSYINALLKVITSTSRVLIYIPDIENYNSVKNSILVRETIADKRISITLAGDGLEKLVDISQMGISIYNYKFIFMGVLPGYEKYEIEYLELKKQIKYFTELILFQQKTDITLAEKSAVNELGNYKDIIEQFSVNQLIKELKNIDKKIPAIIVSAGPSLDKNINELKKAKNHAFIIGVDTAMKALLRADVVPDIMICIDPRKEKVFFEHEMISQIPAVFAMDIPSTLIEEHKGIKFYIGSGTNNLMDKMSKMYTGESYDILESGGSVANSAFSLAIEAGFKTIILVGQDLAFTNGKGHTKDAYDNEQKNIDDASKRDDFCIVEDIYGNPIKTETRMRSYINWFEGMILKHYDVKVIDATEGGALIKGTIIETLNKAIENECTGNECCISNVINNMLPFYNEIQQQEISEYIRNISNRLLELNEKFHTGKNAYLDLQKILKGTIKGDIQVVMKTITEVNSLSDTEPLMDLIIKFSIQDEYNARDSIGNGNSEDVDNLIYSGINLIDGYIKGITRFYKVTKKLYQ